MRSLMLLSMLLVGCRSKSNAASGSVITSEVSSEDSGDGDVDGPPDKPDTAEPDTGDPPEDPPDAYTGPVGVWSSCNGTLTLTEESYTWQNLSGSCTLTGLTSFAEGTLTFAEVDRSRCEEAPWWIDLFAEEPPAFTPNVDETRLTLTPDGVEASGEVAQFEVMLDYAFWELTTSEGYVNHARLCTIDGNFFSGHYKNIDGSCEFLSCEGKILDQTVGGGEESWTTQCSDECDCSGGVTSTERTPDSLTGTYSGNNCEGSVEGSSVGTPL